MYGNTKKGASPVTLSAFYDGLSPRYDEAILRRAPRYGEMLGLARTRLAGDRLRLVQRDFRELDFEDGSFDLVVSSISIHHVTDDEKRSLFRDLHRLLRPGNVVAYNDQFRGASEEI